MSNQITTITAFVAVDDHGDEGVMGAKMGMTFYPLICADEARTKQMYAIAEDIATLSGMSYRVLQFSGRVDVTEEVIEKYKL